MFKVGDLVEVVDVNDGYFGKRGCVVAIDSAWVVEVDFGHGDVQPMYVGALMKVGGCG